MNLQGLAEGIILQSMDDLWDEKKFTDSVNFFRGEDFRTCADIAKMGIIDQIKLLNMIRAIIDNMRRDRTHRPRNVINRETRQPSLTASVS